MNTIAVIPVYNPEPGLKALVEGLTASGFETLVVDDGSRLDRERFAELPPDVKVLAHPENRGKGRAIKAALEHLLGTKAEFAVFCDGDGQHRIADIVKVAEHAEKTGNVTFGVRDFFQPGIPLRSRVGNIWTSGVMRICFGFKIGDTQTGLRAIPRRLWPALIAMAGERFEYEVKMFPLLKKLHEPLEQVPIETVYLEQNRTSHFKPFTDSVKIYRALFSGV